jgi:uncharacterized membrane protein
MAAVTGIIGILLPIVIANLIGSFLENKKMQDTA